MKSKVKKEYVLNYLMEKLNSNYYEIPFYMGIDGMPIYKPIFDDGGDITAFEWLDEETYKVEKQDKIPVSLMVSNGDYAVIKSIDGSYEVNGASFSATLGFLLSAENVERHIKMVESIEYVRDLMLGNFDLMKGTRYDFGADTAEMYAWLVATHCDDPQIGSELIINGQRYLEYSLTIDLDISDNISYGNQYEWYVASQTKNWVVSTKTYYDSCKKEKIILNQLAYSTPKPNLFPNVNTKEFGTAMGVIYTFDGTQQIQYYVLEYKQNEYERLVPIIVSWGSAQSLSGFQMLRNNLLSKIEIEKAQMIHSLASTRGWALTLTLQLIDTKPTVVSLFRETLPKKDNMNLNYKLKAVYKKKVINGDNITFETYDDLGFELDLIPQDSGTSSVHGDNIVFTVSLVPAWGSLNG